MSLSRPLDGPGTLRSVGHMTWLGFGLMVLVLAILSPLVAGEAVVTIIGVILFAAGLGQLYQGFSSKSGWDRLQTLILGAITTLCAFFVFANPLAGLAFLSLLLVVFFVADGLWKFVASFNGLLRGGCGSAAAACFCSSLACSYEASGRCRACGRSASCSA